MSGVQTEHRPLNTDSRRLSVFSGGALLAITLAAGLAHAQDLTPLDRAAHTYRTAHTVRATFDQTLTNPMTGGTHTARGELFEQGPSRFALRFTDPAGDALVSDGTTFWMYLPSSAKGQVLKMSLAQGATFDFLTELLDAPREHYTVSSRPDATVDGHAVAVYALTPKDPAKAPFTHATLWVGRTDALIWQLEVVEPAGAVRRIRFTGMQTDVPLPKGALTFEPPAGVKVVDPTAMFGKK